MELLRDYRDYSQFKDAEGAWDREGLRSTLLAMFLAGRYLLMHEDPVQHAELTVAAFQPPGVETPLRPEDFIPSESWATYFGRKADTANRGKRQAEEEKRLAIEELRKTEEALRKVAEQQRKAEVMIGRVIAQRRQQGRSNAEIAEELGCTVPEVLQRCPADPDVA